VSSLGGLDVLVKNVAYQRSVDDFSEITDEQWRRTFAVNVDSFFHVTKAAVPHLADGGAIINTASINGLRGNKSLIDYSATKGAVIALTTRWPRRCPSGASGSTALPPARSGRR
jgi:NAD(P)-dependent dehydrogenase (short-subunit alcohol dehydrogenase family)